MDFTGLNVYLSGPIEASTDPNSWRNQLRPSLENMGLHVWDPLVKPDWMDKISGPEQAAWKGQLIFEASTPSQCGVSLDLKEIIRKNKQIRDVCLALTRSCDMMIVRISRKTFTVGTWEELVVANQLNKPIFCLCDENDVIPSMWLVDMLNAYHNFDKIFFTNQNILIQHLEGIKNGNIEVDNITWAVKTY